MAARGDSSRIARPLDPASFTPHFEWRSRSLFAEDVALADVATRFGTPAYVYSRSAIEDAYRQYRRAFRSIPTTICYAVKANSNLSVLRLLAKQGGNFDIVSGGELYRLRRAGIPARRAIFSGVGKTREEIREALRAGIFCFNIESESELDLLLDEASRARRRAPAAIRVNPDVEAGGHRHIATGHHRHKFGVDWRNARRLYLAHRNSRWLEWKGISAHIGSQVLRIEPVRKAAVRMAAFLVDLRKNGVALEHLDLGGGLGIRYANENPLRIEDYARAIIKAVKPLRCRLLLEPGRSIVGAAGVLLMRVLLTKSNRGRNFIVVDAAMNDFLRPALYGGVHPITRVTRAAPQSKIVRADIVGPVCESGDCFLKDWPIEEVHEGNVLALWGAGAYGFAESSNYNSRPRPVEILVHGRKAQAIRRRESRRDLVRGE
ncbi:MAG: diaminopimelate decarboxylase [Candidatus Acidiferrales bacterium]